MNMAANATVVMPLVFAVWTLIQYWIAAIRSQGLGHYLRHELFTPVCRGRSISCWLRSTCLSC